MNREASMNIIEFRNVSKLYYRHGERLLLRNRLQQWMSGKRPESFAAVKNISFTVQRGESLAVGRQRGHGLLAFLRVHDTPFSPFSFLTPLFYARTC